MKVNELNTRLEVFKKQAETDFETAKAVGVAQNLILRAQELSIYHDKKGRFGWQDDAYTSPEEMLLQGERIIEKLEQGVAPFKSRFIEPRYSIIDHCFIKKGDEHHLFYIRSKLVTVWAESATDNFGHAVSKDLINWEIKEPVLQCTPFAWDNYQVWAPHIIFYKDEYYMFYTGVNYQAAQAIGLAKSKDLYHWERVGDGPVIIPGTWSDWRTDKWSDCRDPMVLEDDGVFYCYYCTSVITENGERAALGIASSTDLVHWKDEGPVLLKNAMAPPESPYVVKKDDRYYLFYYNYSCGTAYAVSDDPLKNWQDVDEDKQCLVQGVSASEVYQDTDGKWYLSIISHEPNQIHFLEFRDLEWVDGVPVII